MNEDRYRRLGEMATAIYNDRPQPSGNPGPAEKALDDVNKPIVGRELRQQGDLGFYRVDRIPDGLQEVKIEPAPEFVESVPEARHWYELKLGRGPGSPILALAPNHLLLVDPGVRVFRLGAHVCLEVAELAQIQHPEHGVLELDKGLWRVEPIGEFDHLTEEAGPIR